jgi:type IV secretion system protein VirB9
MIDIIALAAALGLIASPAGGARAAPRQHSGSAAVARANRAALREPARSAFAGASETMPFSAGALYHVPTRPGRVTDIVLQPGETLGAVASGDTARWIIGNTDSGTAAEKRTHVLVKPAAAGLETNLVITTDRRTYHLLLTSSADAAITSLAWSYPADALIALRAAQTSAAAAAPVVAGLDVTALRFDYAISGDHPAWRPLRAFDDGTRTYIQFPGTLGIGEAPPLFVIADGKVELVNYRVSGRYYVVDRLFDIAELRLGTHHQQVVRIARTAGGKGGA